VVTRLYAQLKKSSPELAERFAYLEMRGEAAARAASAGAAKEKVLWEE